MDFLVSAHHLAHELIRGLGVKKMSTNATKSTLQFMIQKIILMLLLSFALSNCQNLNTDSNEPLAVAPTCAAANAANSCPAESSVTINGRTICSPVLAPYAKHRLDLNKYLIDVTFTNGSQEHMELEWPENTPTGSFTCGTNGVFCGYGGAPAVEGNCMVTGGSVNITGVGVGAGDRITGTFQFTLESVPGFGCGIQMACGSFNLIRGTDE